VDHLCFNDPLFQNSSIPLFPETNVMNKLVTIEQLVEIINQARSEGKKFAWTNGCFDIIHAGHIDYLEKSKVYGDFLVVGLNSDASVKKIKGFFRKGSGKSTLFDCVCGLCYHFF
jgi:cytidyltransferase-like protein